MNQYGEDIQQVVDEAIDDLAEFERDFTPEPDKAAIRAAFRAALQDSALYDQFVAQYGQDAWDRRVSRL